MLDELDKEIKKYKLDDLLFSLGELSREFFINDDFIKIVPWQRRIGGLIQTFNQMIPAWVLADLSYIAIRNSNDHKSQVASFEDIGKLVNLAAKTSDELAAKRKGEIAKEDMKLHILLGLSQKQFWYQEINRGGSLFYNFLRYFILLTDIPRIHFSHHKQPNDDMLELTGFDIKSFAQLLMAGFAWVHNSSSINFKVTTELKEKCPILTDGNLRSCFGHFTSDYNYYRGAAFPNNPLFFKPIIMTSTNRFLISNAFIWARKFYEGIYWLIRDKYIKLQSQEFTNNFGEYYEKYIENVLGFYLQTSQFEKVTGGERRKADWLIHTEKYILIVEQKSCLMTISLKEEYPSLMQLDKYLSNFIEAYQQLADTENNLGRSDKVIIKLILHFEKFYLGEALIKERVNSLVKDDLHDLSNYYFIDTEEFEKLMQVLSEDATAFNKIMETKIEYEDNAPISEGREFIHVINKCTSVTHIKYLEDHRHFFDALIEGV